MFRSTLALVAGFSIIFGVATARAEVSDPLSAPYQVSADDINQAVGKALVAKGAGGRVQAELARSGQGNGPVYAGKVPVTLDIKSLAFDARSSRWNANLMFVSGAQVITALPVSGRYQEMTEVPVLKRQLRSGETINAADLALMEFPLIRTRGDTVSDSAKLVGQSPRVAISPNRPIRESEITAPSVMKKNALVTLQYKAGALEISVSGQALDSGAKGDVISVRNLNSKQIVRAVVEDAQYVRVEPLVQTGQIAEAPHVN